MRLDSNLTTTLYKSFTYLLTYTYIELPQHTVDTFKFWMHVKCIVSYRIGCRTLDPGHALPGHSPPSTIPGKVPPGKGRLSGALVLGGVLFLWGGVVGGECPWGHLPGHLTYINDPGQGRLSGALVLGGTFPVGRIVGSAGGANVQEGTSPGGECLDTCRVLMRCYCLVQVCRHAGNGRKVGHRHQLLQHHHPRCGRRRSLSNDRGLASRRRSWRGWTTSSPCRTIWPTVAGRCSPTSCLSANSRSKSGSRTKEPSWKEPLAPQRTSVKPSRPLLNIFTHTHYFEDDQTDQKLRKMIECFKCY